MLSYPGGKRGPGVYHRLINLMPPHPVYCEPFLGAGAVMSIKRPAAYNIGVDCNREVIAGWSTSGGIATFAGTGGTAAGLVEAPLKASSGGNGTAAGLAKAPLSAGNGETAARIPEFRFLRGDGLTFLASYPFQPLDLVYCDPPYLMETRSGGRLYKHEFSDDQHRELLQTALLLPCRVMVSGYWSELYACRLQGWNCIHFDAMTRGGMATEWVWYNFPDPVELHDYRFAVLGNRQRTDFRRMVERQVKRLERMPLLKRRALLAAIAESGESATEDLNGGNTTGSGSGGYATWARAGLQ